MEDRGAPTEKLVVKNVAETVAVGAAGLAQEASGKYYFLDIATG